MDLRASLNTPGLAIADGTVVVSKTNGGGVNTGYDHYLVIQHDGYCALYAHLIRQGLPVGTKVKAGQKVCRTGNTGASTAPHLHFEIRIGTVTATFFIKDKVGMMSGAVNPEFFEIVPEYLVILREKTNSADLWVKFIDENKEHSIGKYLPELIVKVSK